ncbi:hypothetical protein AURDEDRAFT_121921 [Auricularia subglabra TFB-10046 SS5]|nr:hypothetical protein AURDEDRAFT_121921 [Auricularia subglabra TFB-10046 SS5]
MPAAQLASTRTLLTLLAAFCMFGSGLAFALHAVPGRESTFLAWAFTIYAIGIVVTLVWQSALSVELRDFSGRMYCNRRGTVMALATGFGTVTLGTLFLGFAMTRSAISGACGHCSTASRDRQKTRLHLVSDESSCTPISALNTPIPAPYSNSSVGTIATSLEKSLPVPPAYPALPSLSGVGGDFQMPRP